MLILKTLQTHTWLQKSVPIQPNTSQRLPVANEELRVKSCNPRKHRCLAKRDAARRGEDSRGEAQAPGVPGPSIALGGNQREKKTMHVKPAVGSERVFSAKCEMSCSLRECLDS